MASKGKGKLNPKYLMDILIVVIFFAAVLPTIVTSITTAKGSVVANSTEYILLGLVVLFIILGFVYAIIRGMI
jgi:hypothetical protein